MIINMNGAKAPETPSSVLQEKTVTPETLPTVIGPDEGYDGLSQVTVNPDSQLKAENIRSGKSIFGVTGAFVGVPTPDSRWLQYFNSPSASNLCELDTDMFGDLSSSIYPSGIFTNRYYSKINVDDVYTFNARHGETTGIFEGIHTYENQNIFCTDVLIHVRSHISAPKTFYKSYFYKFPTLISDDGWYITEGMFREMTLHPDNPEIVLDSKFTGTTSHYAFYGIKTYTIVDGSMVYGPVTIRITEDAGFLMLGQNTFGNTDYPYTLIMEKTTPPGLKYDSTLIQGGIGRIIVPKGCLEAYQTKQYWSNFASIMEEAQ